MYLWSSCVSCSKTFQLTQTPIAPHAADSQLEQDTKVSNTQWHRPVGRTLLDIATTYRSTIDSKLLEFDVCERMCALTLHALDLVLKQCRRLALRPVNMCCQVLSPNCLSILRIVNQLRLQSVKHFRSRPKQTLGLNQTLTFPHVY